MMEEIRDTDRMEDGNDEETEDILEEELGDEALQLLQLRTRFLWRPSYTTSARLRLPPPGNGMKTVQFSCEIENDQGERRWDFAIGNRFAHGFCEPDDESEDNRFMNALIDDLRTDSQNLCNLPIMEYEDNNLPIEEEPTCLSLASMDLSRADDWRPTEATKLDIENGIDMRDVWDFRLWFEGHCTMPIYSLELVKWHKAAYQWLELPIWQFSQPLELHFFVDGSTCDKRCGSACVLFVLQEEGWNFGGYVQNSSSTLTDSFQAELEGNLLASKWAFDLLKLLRWNDFCLPEIYLHYDNMGAAKTIEGSWKGRPSSTLFSVARSIQHLLWQDFRTSFHIVHDKGHLGNPGNEAADSAAYAAARCDFGHTFWNQICGAKAAKCANWLWLLYREDLKDFWQEGHLLLPKPVAHFDHEVAKALGGPHEENESRAEIWMELNLVSYNVMTLGEGSGHRPPIGEIESILRQGDEGGYHVMALQETRLKRQIPNSNAWFYCFSTKADKKGNGGVVLAFNKNRRLGKNKEGKPILWKEHNFKYIDGNEKYLIVRIDHPLLKAVFVCGHAPHSGAEPKDIASWWDRLWMAIPGKQRHLPIFFLGDANAKVGSITSKHIHCHGEEEENYNGACFHNFLARTGSWLPATWQEYHVGESYTWVHPCGSTSRIDYVGLPLEWSTARVTSSVSNALCAARCLWDHRPVEVRAWMKVNCDGSAGRNEIGKRQVGCRGVSECSKYNLQEEIRNLPTVTWDVDVHRHALELQNRIYTITKAYETTHPRPRKDYLDEFTWDLVCAKKVAKKDYFARKDGLRLGCLRIMFDAWKTGDGTQLDRNWLRTKHGDLACAERRYRVSSITAQSRIREVDNVFFEGFTKRLEENDSAQNQRKMWREVKRYLPSTKAKKGLMKASQKDTLDDLWAPYLCEMEAGTVTGPEMTYSECISRQNAQRQCRAPRDELPTLVEMEWMMHCTNPNRCCGPDGIGPDIIKDMAAPLAPHACVADGTSLLERGNFEDDSKRYGFREDTREVPRNHVDFGHWQENPGSTSSYHHQAH